MNTTKIEKSIKDLTNNINPESFLFDLLSIYDFPKATITRLKKGDGNLSKNEGEYLAKNKFFFKAIQDNDLHLTIDELQTNEALLKHRPRFLIVTDYKTFLAQDLKTYDSLDIPIKELADQHEFFFPWMGREKSKLVNEAVADIKAANKMGQLYDLIVENNPTFVSEEHKKHALNVFFAQLLFCLFAEDTGLFEDGIFRNTIATYSNEDGSDLNKILSNIFQSLGTKDKTNFPTYCKNLPYVGGELFEGKIDLPVFSRKARSNIIEAGKLNWCDINPDIFGSMIQIISSPEDRASLGEHYTSVSNIMKVINPLFMDSLNEQFESCDKEKDYEKLLKRIYALKIFDPASGSGNFLIVSYKELCRLEMKIYKTLQQINFSKWQLASLGILANNFYAITLQDFDTQIARISFYITEHQMNQELQDIFGSSKPTLPFDISLNIKQGNSVRECWDHFLKIKEQDEIYIIGNPPYVGYRNRTTYQKKDTKFFYNKTSTNDYCAIWILKAKALISSSNNVSAAFVTTNSVSQGEQVKNIWSKVLKDDVEIFFAHQSFKWANNAQNNAAVMCVIFGLSKIKRKKYIYTENRKISVKEIGPYLTESNIIVGRTSKPLFNLPKMIGGDFARDGNHLFFENSEKKSICSQYPEAKNFFKRCVGGNDFLKGIKRWCLWIDESEYTNAKRIQPIKNVLDKVSSFRAESSREGTQKYADKPYRFTEIKYQQGQKFFIPTTTSEHRDYLPIGVYDSEYVIIAPHQVIYEPPLFLFSILSSKIHFLWIKSVCGRLESRIRYSSALGYNTFPMITLSSDDKKKLELFALEILDTRELFADKTISQMYDPKNMPDKLLNCHLKIDEYLEKIYQIKSSSSDFEKVNVLLNLYKDKIQE